MFKGSALLVSLIATVISYAVWTLRKAKARGRLQEIDEGRRCIACDGTDLQRNEGVARCLRCGHVVSLASLRAAVVRPDEIANVTRPDDRTR